MRFRRSGAGAKGGAPRFAADARGAVAPMFGVLFAFALLPMGGAAIDLSRVLSSRSAMQDSLDAAALALAKMPLNSTQAELQAAADRWMEANLKDPNLKNWRITVGAEYADDRTTISKLDLKSTGTVTSIFNGDIGGVTFGQYPVGAETVSSWGLQRVEVAMVLDNTGSMLESDGSGGTKAAALKDASKALIDSLSETAIASGDRNVFKVAMVPFATYVNVGASNKGAWITGRSPYDHDLFTTPTDRFDLFQKLGVSWAGCVESRPMPYDASDATPSTSVPDSMFTPHFAVDEPDDSWSGRDLYYNNYLPDGVGEAQPFQVKQGRPEKYAGATIQRVRDTIYGQMTNNGPNKDCPSVPIIRLTTNYNAVKTAIDNLAPAGNTHIPLGLVWGWHAISPKAPFSDGVAYGAENVRKVVILVTDGANTYFAGTASPAKSINNSLNASKTAWVTTDNSVYTAYGYVWQNRIQQNGGIDGDPARAMNDRLVELCRNMKTAGVTLYTIPLRITDANTKSMLQNCASTPDKYMEASTGDELRENFKSIAGSISALRISK